MVVRLSTFILFFSILLAGSAVHAKVVKSKSCAAIQQTIQQLPQQGGEVVIPAGVYTCTTPIIIDRNNVNLRGVGAGTLLRLADGANAPVIIMGQATPIPDSKRSNISVSDLIIDGNRENQTAECMGGPCSQEFPLRNNGISIRYCHDCRVERVTVHSAASGGLVAQAGGRTILRVRIHLCGRTN